MATATNGAEILFPTARAEWNITHIGINRSGARLCHIASSITVANGSRLRIGVGDLSITNSGSDWTPAGLRAMLTDHMQGTFYISLHSAEPTAADAHELSGDGYAQRPSAAADWTVA